MRLATAAARTVAVALFIAAAEAPAIAALAAPDDPQRTIAIMRHQLAQYRDALIQTQDVAIAAQAENAVLKDELARAACPAAAPAKPKPPKP